MLIHMVHLAASKTLKIDKNKSPSAHPVQIKMHICGGSIPAAARQGGPLSNICAWKRTTSHEADLTRRCDFLGWAVSSSSFRLPRRLLQSKWNLTLAPWLLFVGSARVSWGLVYANFSVEEFVQTLIRLALDCPSASHDPASPLGGWAPVLGLCHRHHPSSIRHHPSSSVVIIIIPIIILTVTTVVFITVITMIIINIIIITSLSSSSPLSLL